MNTRVDSLGNIAWPWPRTQGSWPLNAYLWTVPGGRYHPGLHWTPSLLLPLPSLSILLTCELFPGDVTTQGFIELLPCSSLSLPYLSYLPVNCSRGTLPPRASLNSFPAPPSPFPIYLTYLWTVPGGCYHPGLHWTPSLLLPLPAPPSPFPIYLTYLWTVPGGRYHPGLCWTPSLLLPLPSLSILLTCELFPGDVTTQGFVELLPCSSLSLPYLSYLPVNCSRGMLPPRALLNSFPAPPSPFPIYLTYLWTVPGGRYHPGLCWTPSLLLPLPSLSILLTSELFPGDVTTQGFVELLPCSSLSLPYLSYLPVNCSRGTLPPRASLNSFPAPPSPFPMGRKPIVDPGRAVRKQTMTDDDSSSNMDIGH